MMPTRPSSDALPTWTQTPPDSLRLVWSDEFDGPVGAPPDPSKWGYQRGGEGWGNEEFQFYTDQPENAALNGESCLAITAEAVTNPDAANLKCWYGPCRYTSSRLITFGKFSFTYGVVAARINLPYGQGIWPALWMLGEDFFDIGWPACGEIDIMENIGKEPGIVHGTVHGPGYSGEKGIGGQFELPEGRVLKDDFHLFGVEWLPGLIRWSMDNQIYFEIRQNQLPQGAPWAFDHPFFLLLNLAVGGFWPGYPDETTEFPQTMLIDYVRVYQAM